MKKILPYLPLLLILFLASCLRLVKLGSAPSSLYWEESALGYDAYSIWKTGKDFHGNSFPLIAFESFGDHKASGYFYVAAPFVGIFGLNNWSIRLPSAIAGIVSVLLIYLIAMELFKDKRTSLMTALTLSVLPWHIQFSRAAFEVNLATLWMMLGIYLLLLTRKKTFWILPSGLLFVLSAYTYQSARVLAPLIALLFLLWVGKKLFRSVWLGITVMLCAGLMLPMILNIRNPIVSQRFAETSLFSTSPAVEQTNALRAADDNTMLSHIIHHRYLVWGREIMGGMLSQLSPQFLWVKGDNNPRHQTGYTGLLYWWSIFPLLTLIGVKKISSEKKAITFALLWILLATIPPALTNLTPHTLRFLPASPAFALLIGFGLAKMMSWKKTMVSLFLFLLIVLEWGAYEFDYFTGYQIRSASSWQYGYKQAINFVAHYPNQEQLVQVTRAYGRPSMYFLYYLGYDPRLIQEVAVTLPKDQGELLAFDRFSFGPIDESEKGLAVSDKPLITGTLLQQINFLDATPAFYIYEIK